jgi:hypothetical protein
MGGKQATNKDGNIYEADTVMLHMLRIPHIQDMGRTLIMVGIIVDSLKE